MNAVDGVPLGDGRQLLLLQDPCVSRSHVTIRHSIRTTECLDVRSFRPLCGCALVFGKLGSSSSSVSVPGSSGLDRVSTFRRSSAAPVSPSHTSDGQMTVRHELTELTNCVNAVCRTVRFDGAAGGQILPAFLLQELALVFLAVGRVCGRVRAALIVLQLREIAVRVGVVIYRQRLQ